MKIEMKKFKKILENPDAVKNNLLSIDTARLFPLCQIKAQGFALASPSNDQIVLGEDN
jgi:hypothetical protein